MERQFTELEKLRREKIKAYLQKGINPYSRDISFSDSSKTLHEKYNNFSKEELKEKQFDASLIFRLLTKRGPFLSGKDAFGKAQAYVGKDSNKDLIDLKEMFDVGDIIKVNGEVMKTNTGELTIKAADLKLISKSLKPLPEKFHGLKDVEERYRRRYVDLLTSEEVTKTFWTRTKIISSIRKYFDNLGYMEADTPVLSSILGGAAAKPFKTFHNALDMEFYLRIATELPLKRLLVGGVDRVYEIGRLFRNEGIDTTHNPEFTTIEFYEAFSNLQGMMERTETLIKTLATDLEREKFEYKGNNINLIDPFEKIEMAQAVSNAIGHEVKNMSKEELTKIALDHKIKIEPYFEYGHIINAIFEEIVEPSIIKPTFIYGHPIEISPLAAINLDDKRFTDRAELFIGGKEYANMFTELNDPIDQMQRFESQVKEAKQGNDEASEIDHDFVEALEFAMPPAGGCGIGIDRLVMLLTGKTSIREVILFPHLKNKKIKNGEPKDD